MRKVSAINTRLECLWLGRGTINPLKCAEAGKQSIIVTNAARKSVSTLVYTYHQTKSSILSPSHREWMYTCISPWIPVAPHLNPRAVGVIYAARHSIISSRKTTLFTIGSRPKSKRLAAKISVGVANSEAAKNKEIRCDAQCLAKDVWISCDRDLYTSAKTAFGQC